MGSLLAQGMIAGEPGWPPVEEEQCRGEGSIRIQMIDKKKPWESRASLTNRKVVSEMLAPGSTVRGEKPFRERVWSQPLKELDWLWVSS